MTALPAVELPPLLKPTQIAKACRGGGWSRKVTLTELRNAGLLERDRDGLHWRVSASRLRERRPDIYDRVFRFAAAEQARVARAQAR